MDFALLHEAEIGERAFETGSIRVCGQPIGPPVNRVIKDPAFRMAFSPD